MQLVKNSELIGDSLFPQFHRRFTLAFIICNIGRYSTTLKNHSENRQLILSIADLIFSFRACHPGRLGKTMAIKRLAQWLTRSLGLLYIVVSSTFFLLSHYCPVTMLYSSIQIHEYQGFIWVFLHKISIWGQYIY